MTKNVVKELVQNINFVQTDRLSEEKKRGEFLKRFEVKSASTASLPILQENLFLIKEINPSVLTSVGLSRKPRPSSGT